jgi:hypothetical protein
MERCHKSVTYAPTPGAASRVATALSEMWQKTPYEEGAEVRGVGAGGIVVLALAAYFWAYQVATNR